MAQLRFLISCLILVLLTSCNSQEKLEVVLNSYKGYSRNDLEKVFGPPKHINESQEGKVLHFGHSYDEIVMPTLPSQTTPTNVFSALGNSMQSFTGSGGVYTYYCDISFVLDNKSQIKTWSYQYNKNQCSQYAKRNYVNPKYVLDLPKKLTYFYGFDYEKVKKGIKITNVDKRSKAFDVGLRTGDIIQKINNESVVGLPLEFAQELFSNTNKYKLEINRDSQIIELVIEVSSMPALDYLAKSTKNFLGFD